MKNKVPLIDGTIPKPLESDDRAIYLAWVRANDLVLLWILNSIDSDIKKTLEYFTFEKDVWDELHVRYAKFDLARVFQLEKDLANISKGSQSLVQYYNQFKVLWDEYINFRPLLKCNCGAMNLCTCELLKSVANTQEQDSVMKFLIGLDDSYSALRSQLFFVSPFPPLGKVFSLLLQEESQRTLHSQTDSTDSWLCWLEMAITLVLLKIRKSHSSVHIVRVLATLWTDASSL